MKVNHSIVAVLCVMLIYSSCTNRPQPVWQKVNIDSTIPKNLIFNKLNKQYDYRGPLPNDTPGIKTSDVSYVNDRNRSINDSTYAKLNNCEAYLKADTLMIKIGLSNFFVGSGFTINCTNQHFFIEPYYWTDSMLKKDAPTFQWLYQEVNLNKPVYQINDSIYGFVRFKIIENDNGQIINHVAHGYFRSRVRKKNW